MCTRSCGGRTGVVAEAGSVLVSPLLAAPHAPGMVWHHPYGPYAISQFARSILAWVPVALSSCQEMLLDMLVSLVSEPRCYACLCRSTLQVVVAVKVGFWCLAFPWISSRADRRPGLFVFFCFAGVFVSRCFDRCALLRNKFGPEAAH